MSLWASEGDQNFFKKKNNGFWKSPRLVLEPPVFKKKKHEIGKSSSVFGLKMKNYAKPQLEQNCLGIKGYDDSFLLISRQLSFQDIPKAQALCGNR